MANRERGEVAIEIGGKSYTCCLDLNAQIEVESLFSTPAREVSIIEIAAKAEHGYARYLRAVIWGLFRKYHPDVTLEATSDLVQLAGGLVPMLGLMRVALGLAQPDPKDVAELAQGTKDSKKRPRTAQAPANGVGATSTSKPVAVA